MEDKPEISELCPSQFGKMYDPIRQRKSQSKEDVNSNKTNDMGNADCQKEEGDEDFNFIISKDYPHLTRIRLPKIIKIRDPLPGEVALWKKRSFPKAMRIHKKREDTNPHRYFLSELMLYTAFTDEKDLGCDNEEKCSQLYLKSKDNIQYVKRYLMPFAEGVDAARYYVQEAIKNGQEETTIGDELDPELEKEILECQDEENLLHPDFVHLNPDELDLESNVLQTKKTVRTIDI